MGEDKYHFVEFGEYCKNCKYFERVGTEEPCNECLMERARLNTTKPLNYVSNSDEKKQN